MTGDAQHAQGISWVNTSAFGATVSNYNLCTKSAELAKILGVAGTKVLGKVRPTQRLTGVDGNIPAMAKAELSTLSSVQRKFRASCGLQNCRWRENLQDVGEECEDAVCSLWSCRPAPSLVCEV